MSPPAVVLVHGPFADASSWNGVIRRLQAKGVKVVVPANSRSLRSLPNVILEAVAAA